MKKTISREFIIDKVAQDVIFPPEDGTVVLYIMQRMTAELLGATFTFITNVCRK